MMLEKDELTYEVRLLCRNCGREWIENVDKGIYVRYEKDNVYMIKRGDAYENRGYFECPKCGLNKKIARFSLNGEFKK